MREVVSRRHPIYGYPLWMIAEDGRDAWHLGGPWRTRAKAEQRLREEAPALTDTDGFTESVVVLPPGGTVAVHAVTREGSLAEISSVGMLRVRTPQGYPGAAPIELVEQVIAAYRAVATREERSNG